MGGEPGPGDSVVDVGAHPAACAPFTQVALDGTVTLAPGVPPRRGGYLWSSSSLDACGEAPRRALFDHLLATSADAFTAQEQLHQHAWPDRRHLSALMSRPDACTVSRTSIVLSPGGMHMRYSPIIDGCPAGVTAAELVMAWPSARVAA